MKKIGVNIFPFILGRFSFITNAMNFLIHSLNRFGKNCLQVAGFLESGALYAAITHDPRSEYNWQKSERSKRQQNWGVGRV